VYVPEHVIIGMGIKEKDSVKWVTGKVRAQTTTEEIKQIIEYGGKVLKIYWCLHYPNRTEGSKLFKSYMDLADIVKKAGTLEGNEGKRTIGKLMKNEPYGKFGSDYKVKINGEDRTNISVANFIRAYARMEMRKLCFKIKKMGGKIFYVDTDSVVTNIELPEYMISKTVGGKLKFEGCFDISGFLAKKTYYVRDSTGKHGMKMARKGFPLKEMMNEDVWKRALSGESVLIPDEYWKKEDF
jgi:hypothetical protein